jgi:hypothetical protein
VARVWVLVAQVPVLVALARVVVAVLVALAPVAVARVPVAVALVANLANGQGVLESVVDLPMTAIGPLDHPQTMPLTVATVPPRFSLRYILTVPPHPITHAGRVRIFSVFEIPVTISCLPSLSPTLVLDRLAASNGAARIRK